MKPSPKVLIAILTVAALAVAVGAVLKEDKGRT